MSSKDRIVCSVPPPAEDAKDLRKDEGRIGPFVFHDPFS